MWRNIHTSDQVSQCSGKVLIEYNRFCGILFWFTYSWKKNFPYLNLTSLIKYHTPSLLLRHWMTFYFSVVPEFWLNINWHLHLSEWLMLTWDVKDIADQDVQSDCCNQWIADVYCTPDYIQFSSCMTVSWKHHVHPCCILKLPSLHVGFLHIIHT